MYRCVYVCGCEYGQEGFLLSGDDPTFFCLGYKLEDGRRSNIATILSFFKKLN